MDLPKKNKPELGKLNEAVLLVVFCRPKESLQVFNAIRKARPTRFYLVSDGARANRPDEKKVVENLREELLRRIDWPCEVNLRFREHNKGCHPGMEDAITWFFDHEERGIILEDDCLPDSTFFSYCAELLERYQRSDDVMAICGTNFCAVDDLDTSYFFSRFSQIWGWATWRSAWQKYDPALTAWPTYKASGKLKEFASPVGAQAYKKTFDRVSGSADQAWDAQWLFSIFHHQGLSIMPCTNLVKNIGGQEGTNTQGYDPFLNWPTQSLELPFVHPKEVACNESADQKISRQVSPRNYRRTIRLMFKRWGIGAFHRLFKAALFMVKRVLKRV